MKQADQQSVVARKAIPKREVVRQVQRHVCTGLRRDRGWKETGGNGQATKILVLIAGRELIVPKPQSVAQ